VDGLDTGDTAWMLASTALVLLMTPGLAFFYGGMVRSKSVLNMIMMSMSAIGVVGILWVLYGYSVAFGNDVGAGLLGDPFEAWGLKGLFVGSYTGDAISYPLSGTIPALVFVGFQATFAIITVALISGAVADRMKFGAWLLFAALWATIVYFPVAHWVFAFSNDDSGVVGGWIANDLALAIVLGKRRGWPRENMRPHNLPFVMLGAGLLWFGWFGFNAGSALGANGIAGFAMVNTIAATCAAMLGWLITEQVRDGRPTSLGAASGVVAGLVAITPSCSSVSPLGAILLGLIAGVVCALAVALKFRFGYDDSLDVVGVHLVGGIIGTVLVGFLADPGSPAGVAGLLYGGGVDQLWRQIVGAAAVLIYSFVLSYIIALIVKAVTGGRLSAEDEATGIDETEHAETAYDFSTLRSLSGIGSPRPDAATAKATEHVPAHASKES
jgi:ammonium transporter, Amt family